jgi:hypothetical protein
MNVPASLRRAALLAATASVGLLSGCVYPYPPMVPQPQPPVPYGEGAMLPPPPPSAPEVNYPMATRTSTPDRVISPYAPYNVINVEGFRSGQLAKDPSDPANPRIFRIP